MVSFGLLRLNKSVDNFVSSSSFIVLFVYLCLFIHSYVRHAIGFVKFFLVWHGF